MVKYPVWIDWTFEGKRIEEVKARISWLVSLEQGGASLSSARAPPPSLSLPENHFSLSVCIYAAGRCKRDSSLVPFSAHFVRFYPGIHSSVVKGAQNQHRPRNHFIHGWFLAFWFLREFWFLSPQFHLVQVESVVSTLGAVSTVSIFSFTCLSFYSSNLQVSLNSGREMW